MAAAEPIPWADPVPDAPWAAPMLAEAHVQSEAAAPVRREYPARVGGGMDYPADDYGPELAALLSRGALALDGLAFLLIWLAFLWIAE